MPFLESYLNINVQVQAMSKSNIWRNLIYISFRKYLSLLVAKYVDKSTEESG